jgi:hypothetical protein
MQFKSTKLHCRKLSELRVSSSVGVGNVSTDIPTTTVSLVHSLDRLTDSQQTEEKNETRESVGNSEGKMNIQKYNFSRAKSKNTGRFRDAMERNKNGFPNVVYDKRTSFASTEKHSPQGTLREFDLLFLHQQRRPDSWIRHFGLLSLQSTTRILVPRKYNHSENPEDSLRIFVDRGTSPIIPSMDSTR